jgi:GTPase-associated system helical domain
MVESNAQAHPDFARWCSEVSMNEESRTGRWLAIDQITTDVIGADVEVLVRLAFRAKPLGVGSKEKSLVERLNYLLEVFRKHDEEFDRNAVREIQILAACTLVNLFRSDARAALAVTTAGVAGGRNPELPMDIFGLAENAIHSLSIAGRKRPDLTLLSVNNVQITHKTAPETLVLGDPATFSAALESLRLAAETAMRTMNQRLNVTIRGMGEYVQVADEELQMLWWLIGERSLDLDVPFNKVAVASQPLIFARELADRTARAPGPIAIGALFARAGLKAQGEASFVDAVNSVSDEWAAKAVNSFDASPVTSPIHFALEKRVETGPGGAWVASWAAVTELEQNYGTTPATLAKLFYRERLLLAAAK